MPAAVNFDTVHEGVDLSGLTGADLTTDGFAAILGQMNIPGFTADSGSDGVVLVNGTTIDNAGASEPRRLAVFDNTCDMVDTTDIDVFMPA